MAAPTRSVAEQLRDAGDQLFRLADLAETPQSAHLATDRLRDEIETVSIMRLEKSRCVARRWPVGRPVIGKPKMMTAIAGVPSSSNEA